MLLFCVWAVRAGIQGDLFLKLEEPVLSLLLRKAADPSDLSMWLYLSLARAHSLVA